MSYDVFISYRRADIQRVQPFVDALREHGLTVWMDQKEINDFAGVTASIRDGLSHSKTLVAWFSAIYPLSRPCQWELTTAFIAAQLEGDPRKRVLIINPEQSPDHIYLPELKDQQYITAPAVNDSKSCDAAVERLAQHISRLTGTLGEIRDLTGPVWYPVQSLGSNRFVGRLKQMWEIHNGLCEGQTVINRLGSPAVVRLTGMGGTGKSLLAEEYALRFGTAYPGGIFWLTMHSVTSDSTGQQSIEAALDSIYRSMASVLGINIKDKNLAMLQGEMKRYFEKQGKAFLWIVDDAPTGVSVKDLEKWYAPHPLGKTLITTRSLEYNSIGCEVRIDKLDHEPAQELLTKRRPPRDAAEKRAVDPILEHLGYHALAIDVAGARLESTPYAYFFEQLSAPGKDALELAAKFTGQLPNGHEASIAGTLIESVNLLDDDARDFLRIASLLQAYRIPAALLARTFSIVYKLEESDAKDRVDLAIYKAKQQSLAESVGDEDFSVLVHTLVSRTIHFTDDHPDRTAELRKGVIEMLNRVLPAVQDIRNHPCLESWIIHARYLTEVVNTQEEAKLLSWVGIHSLTRGSFSEAEKTFRKEYDFLNALLGEEHPDTLTSMNNLAGTLCEQGELNGARQLLEMVLEVSKRVLGEEHPDTSLSAWALFVTLDQLKETEAARQIIDKYLARLLERDPVTLGADQREIREMLEKIIKK